MKYDFSTYILNSLTEADEQKKKEPNITINKDGNKKVIISSNTTEKELVNFFKKYIDDIEIKDEGDKKVYVFNGEQGEYTFENKTNLQFDKLYKKTLEDSRDNTEQKVLDENGFKLLGKTIAYRSALTAWSIINNSGDDFKQAALDVFNDNSEYSIKQLENLDSLLDYSAANLTIKQKINRNDKNDADYEKNLKTYKEYEEQLKTKDNFKTIQTIKKNYEKEFKDKRDLLNQSFNEGMAEQKKDMQAKDYKWKDPATGKEPKGAEKLNQLGDKAYKMLESGVEKFSDFAKRQQGLDKALLTLAVIGVKGMIFGAKVFKNLLTGAIKRTNMHDCLRNTAKFKDVESKIKLFMKEYEEWNKENSEQSKKDDKDKTDDEKKQEADKKKTILMKLSELMNTHVMPYYYAKLAIITACIENKENKYIIKQEDNKWSTYNTSTGRLTVIEDNTILMYHLLKFLTDDKQIIGFRTGFKNVLETFGDEKPDFKLPTDVNFNPTYKTNLSNWLDRASTVKDIKNPHLPFRIEQFKKKWEQFYKEELYKKSFANYKEFLEFCRKAQELLHDVHLPVAKGIKLKFKGDEDAGVPGVITGAKQGENQEEEKVPVTEEVAKEALNNVKYNADDGHVYIKYSEYDGTKDFNVSFNKENAEKKEHLEGFVNVYSKYKDVFEEWVNNNKDNKDLQEPINIMKIALGYNNEEKKEETQESKEEVRQKITEIEKQINNDLNSLKDINELEKLTAQFVELSKDVNDNYTAIVNLNNKNLDDEKRAKLNEPFKGANEDIFNKMLYINLSKKMNEVQSAVYNKVMFYLLLESEENVEQDSYDKLISVLTKDISLEQIDKVKEVYNAFAKDMIEWYKSLNDEQKAAIEKFKNDPLALYLARKTLKKPEEEKNKGQTDEPKDKSGENNQETQST